MFAPLPTVLTRSARRPRGPVPTILAATLTVCLLATACASASDPQRDAASEGFTVPLERVESESAWDHDDGQLPTDALSCTPAWGGDGNGSVADQSASAMPPSISLVQIATLDSAIAGTFGPGGAMYFADRRGTVHRMEDGALSDPIVDLTAETTTDAERGLLGIAFAADCGTLYVSYTDVRGDTRIDAFAVIDGQVDDEGRRNVLHVEQPYANHNGGDIRIGPDDYLYVALGDGGSAGDPLDAGQDRASLLGSILRLDPTGDDPYAIPDDNPFVGIDGAADEIWAYGLRNPWRMAFDRVTGDLWIADVGQNAREEVNRLTAQDAGANLGWNRMEGTLPYSGDAPDDHFPPLFEYGTTSSRCAVTGGFVYRGEVIEGLQGAYVFSDFCEGAIRALKFGDAGSVDEVVLAREVGRVVAFAEDFDGELYVLTLDGNVLMLAP